MPLPVLGATTYIQTLTHVYEPWVDLEMVSGETVLLCSARAPPVAFLMNYSSPGFPLCSGPFFLKIDKSLVLPAVVPRFCAFVACFFGCFAFQVS